MPIELTPSPSSLRYDRYLPLAPSATMGWAHNSPHPSTGPARAIDCVQPGRVRPNGMTNPWAPYGGETYTPSSEVAVNIQARSFPGGGGSVPGSYQSMVGSRVRGASVIAPTSTGSGSLAGGSIMSYNGSLGGQREGWDGILERNHRGHEPDLTSPAAGLPRSQHQQHSMTNWLHAPSSPMNHARMSPSIAILPPSHRLSPSISPSYAHHPASSIHLQPPVANHHPRRSTTVKAVPIDNYCAECCPSCVESRRDSVHERARSRSGAHSLRHGNSPAGSPLRSVPVNGTPVARMVSRSRSARSGRSEKSGRHCSECSA